jgi:hypothetical protein
MFGCISLHSLRGLGRTVWVENPIFRQLCCDTTIPICLWGQGRVHRGRCAWRGRHRSAARKSSLQVSVVSTISHGLLMASGMMGYCPFLMEERGGQRKRVRSGGSCLGDLLFLTFALAEKVLPRYRCFSKYYIVQKHTQCSNGHLRKSGYDMKVTVFGASGVQGPY